MTRRSRFRWRNACWRRAAPSLRWRFVVPVVVIDDEKVAVPLAQCLLEAGVTMIEVTLRRPGAWNALERIIAEVPEIIAGAGSITTTEHLQRLTKMGCRF